MTTPQQNTLRQDFQQVNMALEGVPMLGLGRESWRDKVVPLARDLAVAVDFIEPDFWRFEMQKG